jgi:nuclease-like protein
VRHEGATPDRHWRVKFDGICARCGTPLLRGTPAVWERATRSIHCIECPSSIPTPAPLPADAGVAGASALREFERRKAKRDARIDERFGRFAKVVHAVTIEPPTTRAWATGAVGEQLIAAVLAEVLGVNALHDRRVPGTRGNIDHIVIGQGGVFVVDAKKLDGIIEIRNRGSLLRPDYRSPSGAVIDRVWLGT